MSPVPSQQPDKKRFAALRYRDFRLLWGGELISTTGSQMQLIAVNWHVFQLLKDQSLNLAIFGKNIELGAEALGLGLLGLARILPIIAFALLGGVLADLFDRRRLIIWSQLAAALLTGLLAFITFTGRDSVIAIYGLTALSAAAFAFDNPARQSLVPNLVPPEDLTNAVSLTSLNRQLASIVGPALAGVLVAVVNVSFVYALNAVSFGAVILAVTMIRYRGGATAIGTGLGKGALLEGLRFTYGKKIIWSTMLLDFFATLFSSARTMLPIVTSDILGLGAGAYGVLATAQPVGALVAGVALSLRRDIHRQGEVLLLSVAVYGLATALFAISSVFMVSYLLFALTGAGDMVSTVIRNTIRQLNTPDRLRGRMTGINMVFFMGGPQLGELEAGLVAAVFGVPLAILTGGIATVMLTGWVAWKYPQLRNYVSQEPAYAT